MAHLILPDTPQAKPKKQFKFTLPSITGKFGFSLMAGSQEIFIGIAVARIEVETIVRKKKVNVMKKPLGSARFLRV